MIYLVRKQFVLAPQLHIQMIEMVSNVNEKFQIK